MTLTDAGNRTDLGNTDLASRDLGSTDLGDADPGTCPGNAGHADEERTDPRAELFVRLRACAHGEPEWWRVREEIIKAYRPLARGLAARYGNRGEDREDLLQVAMVGLVKAVNRYEPERGTRFVSFAVPTVLGEIKRHFRDRGWAVRPPRDVQELRARVLEAREDLTQRLGHSPRIGDLAEHLRRPEEDVIEAVVAGEAYHTMSLDRPVNAADADSSPYGETFGAVDGELALVENRQALRAALDRLPERERRIVLLRFHGNLTQREIAEEMGISQMHVSRLITASLTRLRTDMLTGAPEPSPAVPGTRKTPARAGAVAAAARRAGPRRAGPRRAPAVPAPRRPCA